MYKVTVVLEGHPIPLGTELEYVEIVDRQLMYRDSADKEYIADFFCGCYQEDVFCHVDGNSRIDIVGGTTVITGTYTFSLVFRSKKDYQRFNLKNLGFLDGLKNRFVINEITQSKKG